MAVFCQHEISSPLEDLGEKEPHPQGLEESWVVGGAGLIGIFDPDLSVFSPTVGSSLSC